MRAHRAGSLHAAHSGSSRRVSPQQRAKPLLAKAPGFFCPQRREGAPVKSMGWVRGRRSMPACLSCGKAPRSIMPARSAGHIGRGCRVGNAGSNRSVGATRGLGGFRNRRTLRGIHGLSNTQVCQGRSAPTSSRTPGRSNTGFRPGSRTMGQRNPDECPLRFGNLKAAAAT